MAKNMETETNGGEVKLPRLTCTRCGHTWIRRTDQLPATCPKCKNAHWNRPYRYNLKKRSKRAKVTAQA